MAIPYTPLLYHSNYGVGGSRFETLFEHLKKYNVQQCGITDETFFGLPEFIAYAKTYGIQPLVGACITLAPSGTTARLFLFVKNQQGYENLCQILTAQAFGTISHSTIREHAAGLVLLSTSLPLLHELNSAFSNVYHLIFPHDASWNREFPPLAAQEIFYVTEHERILYKLMCSIKKNHFQSTRGALHHLLTPHEFQTVFADYPEAIRNTCRLAELCTFVPERTHWVFSESHSDIYKILEPKMNMLTHVQRARVHNEYRVIKDTGFEPHFSLVYHLKEFALSKGIGMNVRGSAASSYILYLLGLSVVDPLRYNLPFERFLNYQRTEPPDIDVDVEFNQRECLIQEIYDKFGSDYVAHISVINRFQHRARFRDTARAYGISPRELRSINNHSGERLIKNVRILSEQIHNYPHYFSCHASGIVITPKPVQMYVPLYPSPAGPITHFDKDGIQMVGLVKIDILGVRGFPSLFLSKNTINFEDQHVYSFVSGGKTLGCFQIESPMVRQFLKRIKPRTLMDIANAIAIIRPGPSQGGMKEKFLKRLKGEEEISYPHSQLKQALQETLGIPVYQEQILQIAHDFAHFSLSDGDMLRRAMTKERSENKMAELKDTFFSKARLIGYTKKEIETVWSRIEAFSSFGFNKAHSITYATLAYLSAFQKHYNPLEFFCRVINNKGGYYPSYAYINEARRWGLKILSPDINISGDNFTIYNNALITGLNEIKNLSSSAINQIMKYRPFRSAEDFFYHVNVSIDEATSLIKAGALDAFGRTWPQLYFLLLESKLKRKVMPVFRERIPAFHDFSSGAKLLSTFEVMNFLPEHHILEVLYPSRRVRIADLSEQKTISITGTPIARRVILTKRRTLMSFLTIDDETGTLEVIIFPDRFKRHVADSIMEIEGKIEDDSLIAETYTARSF